jgi:hypothetical protein
MDYSVESFSAIMFFAGGNSQEEVWRTITQEASTDIQGEYFFFFILFLSLKTLNLSKFYPENNHK